ncbi:MAG: SCO family protein [Pseudomonadota bacterium]
MYKIVVVNLLTLLMLFSVGIGFSFKSAHAHFNETEQKPGVWLSPPKTMSSQVSFETTQDTIKTSDTIFSGRWSLVYVGYSRCASTCPVDMAKIQNFYKKNQQALQDIPFYFITADNKHDNPTELKKYVQNFNATFHGLIPSEADHKPLLEWFESPFRSMEKNAEILHSSNLYLIDPWLNWRKFYSMPIDQKEILTDLKTLQASIRVN